MAAVVQSHERECAVCTNDFTTPKILPCGHLLCRECVISWMDSKSDAGCPLCTCPIVEHQGNSSQSSADELPTDFVMEAVVESAQVLVKDNMCTVCDDVSAEYICMQCMEKMCKSCTKIHKKMVVSRSHDVESLSTVTPERLAATRHALCADHGDKQGELFCVNHHLVICGSCFSNKHNDCPNVKHLDKNMNSAEKALGLLTEELVKAETNLKQTISSLNVRIQTADVTEQENMALVDKTCDRLQKIVKECRKQLKKLISDSFSKFKNSLNDVKRELEKRLGKVTSHKHLVTRATTVRPRPALIPAAQTLTDRVNNLNLSDELEVEPWVDPSPEIAKYCDDVGKLMKAELQNFEQQRTEAEVRIDETDDRKYISLGVNRNSPADAISLSWYYDLGSIMISSSGVNNKGRLLSGRKKSLMETYQFQSNIGKALKCIRVGSRVGLLVDSSNDLHLYVDGHDQGVAVEKVEQPCFAVFDFNVTQVTSLPTSRRT